MAGINLLPWREESRKQRQKEFGMYAGGAAVISLGVVLLIHMYVNGLIDNQDSRNSYLQSQIHVMEGKIRQIQGIEKEKKLLVAKINVIENLQRNRPAIVHMFEALAKAVPDGIYLTDVKQSGTVLNIAGEAQSNARVSSFMRNLDASPWFSNPALGVIQGGKNNQGGERRFTLTVQQVIPKAG